jgi:hypothetical protein
MSFNPLKRTFDDDTSGSSGPDSPTQFPLLLKDVDGRKKFIFSDEEAARLRLRVERASEQDDLFKDFMERENSQTLAKREKRATHGLAPKGMVVPRKGEAFMIGGSGSAKVPLKESNLEIHNRIKEEQEEKKKKKDKSVAKKQKKEGKVRTLAPYMYS